jgi:hypothetical protein
MRVRSKVATAMAAVGLLLSGGWANASLAGADPVGMQKLEVGGIDVDAYCQQNYGVSQPFWVQVLSSASVSGYAYLDGRGPGEAYRWRCLMVSITNGWSDAGVAAYQAAMESWDPETSPEPLPQDFQGMTIDSQDLPFDMNQACRQQHDDQSWAELGNPDDMTSWKCYTWVLADPMYSNIA